MNVIIWGASGTIGQRILAEALARKHKVTAVVRDTSKIPKNGNNVVIKSADILDPKQIRALIAGQDVVINATSPGKEPIRVVDTAKSLLKALDQQPNIRLLIVGGAGSLEVKPGLQLVDSPSFPEALKGIALAHREALNIYKSSNINWTYVSPAALIQPGERTGKYRVGADTLLVNENGESKISAEDYAVAIMDELEKSEHERARFTVAY